MRSVLLALLLLVTPAMPVVAQTWLYESADTLPSTDTGWGRLAITPDGDHLFAARFGDGLLVWDTRHHHPVTVENSEGASATILVPAAGRAYVAMRDGTVLIVDLATLKPIARTQLGAGPLLTGVYEPTQNRVHLVASSPGKTTWITLDAATGAVLGHAEFNSERMDVPTTDGKGRIFAPMRDRSLLQQLDAKDLSLQKTWKLGDCTMPAAVQWDDVSGRVLVGCRGEKPVFVALDPTSGVVATIPIGAGVDSLVIDEKRHLIVTGNGRDGTMSVIRQEGPNAYSLVETIASRPRARDLVISPATGELFTVSASFTIPAPGPDGKRRPTFYHPDSWTVLAFRPN